MAIQRKKPVTQQKNATAQPAVAKRSSPQPEKRDADEDEETGKKVFELETLEPVEWLPKGYLSVSAINMYQRCPKQFEFRYVHGIKTPPAVQLDEGISHHAWLEADNSRFIREKEHLPEPEARERFLDAWSDKAREARYPGSVRNEVAKRGEGLVKEHLATTAPLMEPVASEKKFELLCGDVPLFGFIDFVGKVKLPGGTKASGVADYKVVKAKKSQNDADNDLQLAIYAKAENTTSTSFVCLTKTATPQSVVITSKQTERRKDWAVRVVQEIGSAIRKGAFPPCAPDSWACSERFCGFWKMCRGAKKL
jgi:CRISPR/Cas system-associated exonuclease Cas4 (RecB family)